MVDPLSDAFEQLGPIHLKRIIRQLQGAALVFDADGDTTIQAEVDDILVVTVGGVTLLTLTDAKATLTKPLFMAELAAALADVAGEGQFWVKSQAPNEPWFTDDAGNDIFLGQADYAGIFRDGNTDPTNITIQHGFEQIAVYDTDMPENISNGVHGDDNIVIGATGVYTIEFSISATPAGTNKTFEFFGFEIAAATSAITSTTEDNPVLVNATGHGFTSTQKVKLAGIATATTLNDRVFTITRITDNQFSLQEDNGGDVDGTGLGVGSGGTAALATELPQIHAHRKFANQDVGNLCSKGIVSLTKGNALELYVKNITDAIDITVEASQFMMQRAG